MRNLRLLLAMTLFSGVVVLASTAFGAETAGPRPAFQLPFRCDETWPASTYDTAEKRVWNATQRRWGAWTFAWSHKNYFDFAKGGGVGLPVVISAPGRALSVDLANGKVVVDHGGGWRTVYQHMTGVDTNLPNKGSLAAGTQIGKVGSKGLSSGPHLHYAQLKDGAPVAPVFDGKSYSFGSSSTYTFTQGNTQYRLLNDRSSTSSLRSANCPSRNDPPVVVSVEGASGRVGSLPTLRISYRDPQCDVTRGLWEGDDRFPPLRDEFAATGSCSGGSGVTSFRRTCYWAGTWVEHVTLTDARGNRSQRFDFTYSCS